MSTTTTYKDETEFHHRLNYIKRKKEKYQRLILQWKLYRYIQQTGKKMAYNKLITLVSSEDQLSFNQEMQHFINPCDMTSIQTRNKNELPRYLFFLFKKGELDRAIINILTTGKVLHLWKGTNQVHLHLLLPMCHILLKWDQEETKQKFYYSAVTFNQQQYYPLELVQVENQLLLESIAKSDEKLRRRFVLGCVDFALRPQPAIKWHKIHRDKRLLLSLLKLWFHTTKTIVHMRKSILLAMIVSFLKHALLDTYDETEGISVENSFLQTLKYNEKILSDVLNKSLLSKKANVHFSLGNELGE